MSVQMTLLPRCRMCRQESNEPHMTEAQCHRWLQLSRDTIMIICQMIGPEIASNCVGGHPMPVAFKIIVALNPTASGSFQGSAGKLHGVSQSAAHSCVQLVTEALFRRLRTFMNRKTKPKLEEAIRPFDPALPFISIMADHQIRYPDPTFPPFQDGSIQPG